MTGAVLSIVSGCGAPQSLPISGPSLSAAGNPATPDKASSYTYTCQNAETSNTDCLVYQGAKIVKTIKTVKIPLGVAAGKDGNFYVGDASKKSIYVFSAGAKKLSATIDNAGNVPFDVAVYSDEIAAANQKSLTFFAKGATKPTRTLKASGVVQGSGAAFDSKGNCYWAFSTSSGSQVDEFKGCKGRGINLKVSGGTPYGIAFDGKDNLYYTSYSSSANGVYVCAGVKSCKLTYSNFINPQYLNFSSGYADLWVSDTGTYSQGAFLDEIEISSGKQIAKISNGISFFDPPSGVASGPGPL